MGSYLKPMLPANHKLILLHFRGLNIKGRQNNSSSNTNTSKENRTRLTNQFRRRIFPESTGAGIFIYQNYIDAHL